MQPRTADSPTTFDSISFVLPIATSSALLAGLLAPDKDAIFFYLSSMLVAFGVGFLGDSLAGKLPDVPVR